MGGEGRSEKGARGSKTRGDGRRRSKGESGRALSCLEGDRTRVRPETPFSTERKQATQAVRDPHVTWKGEGEGSTPQGPQRHRTLTDVTNGLIDIIFMR